MAFGFLTPAAAGPDAQPGGALARRSLPAARFRPCRLAERGAGSGWSSGSGNGARSGSRNCSPEVGAAAGAAELEKAATAAAPPGKDSAETGELRQRSRNARRSSAPAGLVGLGLGPGPSLPSALHSAAPSCPPSPGLTLAAWQDDPDSSRAAAASSGVGGATCSAPGWGALEASSGKGGTPWGPSRGKIRSARRTRYEPPVRLVRFTRKPLGMMESGVFEGQGVKGAPRGLKADEHRSYRASPQQSCEGSLYSWDSGRGTTGRLQAGPANQEWERAPGAGFSPGWAFRGPRGGLRRAPHPTSPWPPRGPSSWLPGRRLPLPPTRRKKIQKGKVQSVKKPGTPRLSCLQGPSRKPGGEATDARPAWGPGPGRTPRSPHTRVCDGCGVGGSRGEGAAGGGCREAIARERVNVLCPYWADEKLRPSCRAAKSTALCLHLTAGARLPSSIDRHCARLWYYENSSGKKGSQCGRSCVLASLWSSGRQPVSGPWSSGLINVPSPMGKGVVRGK